jgi:hypothetical protein
VSSWTAGTGEEKTRQTSKPKFVKIKAENFCRFTSLLTGTETEPATPKETIRTSKPRLYNDKDISVTPKIKARKC